MVFRLLRDSFFPIRTCLGKGWVCIFSRWNDCIAFFSAPSLLQGASLERTAFFLYPHECLNIRTHCRCFGMGALFLEKAKDA